MGRQYDPKEIAEALADALPKDAPRRTELVAVGMVTTALIFGVREEDRAELVDEFCSTLRSSIIGELN